MIGINCVQIPITRKQCSQYCIATLFSQNIEIANQNKFGEIYVVQLSKPLGHPHVYLHIISKCIHMLYVLYLSAKYVNHLRMKELTISISFTIARELFIIIIMILLANSSCDRRSKSSRNNVIFKMLDYYTVTIKQRNFERVI